MSEDILNTPPSQRYPTLTQARTSVLGSFSISDIWMRLESLAHLRDLGPRYKALHDAIAREIEALSASLEPKPIPVAPPPAAVAAANPKPYTEAEAKAMAEQAEARRQAAAKSLEVTAGRPQSDPYATMSTQGPSYAERAEAARQEAIRERTQPVVGHQDLTDAERAAQGSPDANVDRRI